MNYDKYQVTTVLGENSDSLFTLQYTLTYMHTTDSTFS